MLGLEECDATQGTLLPQAPFLLLQCSSKRTVYQRLLPSLACTGRLRHVSHNGHCLCKHGKMTAHLNRGICELCIVECRSQHIFINPEMPRSAHGMSYNCIGFDGNQRSFNDGYHTIHHLNSKLHWTQLPQHFIRGTQQQSLTGNKTPPTDSGY